MMEIVVYHYRLFLIYNKGKNMKYEICYVDKADNNAQKLEIFSDFQKFRNRYIDLKGKLWFTVEGVSVIRSDKDELHEAIFINLSEEVLISYKSTELGVSVLIDSMKASGFNLLDSSIYYKVYKSSGI